MHLPTLHTQPCVWEGRWGQRRRTSRGPPTRTFWVFCVGLCVVSWCVPVVRMSAVWWSRVCMGRGDRVRGLISSPLKRNPPINITSALTHAVPTALLQAHPLTLTFNLSPSALPSP